MHHLGNACKLRTFFNIIHFIWLSSLGVNTLSARYVFNPMNLGGGVLCHFVVPVAYVMMSSWQNTQYPHGINLTWDNQLYTVLFEFGFYVWTSICSAFTSDLPSSNLQIKVNIFGHTFSCKYWLHKSQHLCTQNNPVAHLLTIAPRPFLD